MSEKAARPLSDKMVKEIESKNMDKESPILVRLFKEESELEVWKQDRNGRFALLKTYPICRWSGELGPKIKEGDRQAPEGFYTITPGQMNPNSQYYLSFDLGYPNAYDRAHGRTGAQLMVHGDCSSRGCYSMTDEQISEIYALGRDAFFGGQKSFQVQAYPFRMTPQNFAKHRNNPNIAFWKMLKKGNDHFEVTRLEPKVNVCEKRYVFDAAGAGESARALSFSPAGKCPAFEVPEEIASAVQDKERKDEIQIAELSRRNIAARADQDQRRRRHASGVRRRGEEEPDRRRAAGSRCSSRRRPEPFRPRCGRRASPSLPTRRSSPASRRAALAAMCAARDGHCRDRSADAAGREVEQRQPVRQPVLVEVGRAAEASREERQPDRSHGAPGRPGRRRQGHQDGRSDRAAPKPKPAAKPTSVASQWRDPRQAGRGRADQDHRSASPGATAEPRRPTPQPRRAGAAPRRRPARR